MSQAEDTPRKTDPRSRFEYSDAEVDTLLRKHGIYDLGGTFNPPAIVWWRGIFDDAANLYFSAKASPTYNATYRHLALVEKRTRALLDVLEDEEIDSAIMALVEPLGSRRVLYELLQGAKRWREEIKPHLDDKRQRRGTGSGLDAAIMYLFQMLDWVYQTSGKVLPLYRWDPGKDAYSGKFVDFVCDVFDLLGLDFSRRTIGNHIASQSAHLKQIRHLLGNDQN